MSLVRLHVRRTDKRKEASYHSLDEYMVHAAEWYDAYELTNPTVQRKIYLATDESRLIEEATKRFVLKTEYTNLKLCRRKHPKL